MNEITQHDFGLLRREVKDARAIASNVDHKLTRLIEDSARRPRDGSLMARIAASRLLAQVERRQPAAVAAQHWPLDTELRAAVAPAMTGVAGWSAELLAVAIADISSTLLGPSVFGQLRELSAVSYDFGRRRCGQSTVAVIGGERRLCHRGRRDQRRRVADQRG